MGRASSSSRGRQEEGRRGADRGPGKEGSRERRRVALHHLLKLWIKDDRMTG